jgi:outer membrane receptor protein involved in Fe transport
VESYEVAEDAGVGDEIDEQSNETTSTISTPPGIKTDSESDTEEVFIDLMGVTGSRGTPSDLEFDRSVSITSQADRRRIHASSVPEWISEMPGVYIQNTSPSSGAPIIRGFIGPQNLLLIDDIRLNTSTYRTGPLQYLNITDPFAFHRVEVLRGPGSVLYGSDAFGGVIQMRTPQLELGLPWSTNASIDYGTADSSVITNVDTTGTVGPVVGLLGVSYRVFGSLRGGDGQDVPLSDNRHISARGKFRYVINNAWDVVAAALMTRVDDAGRTERLYLGDYRRNDNVDYLTYVRTTYRTKTFLRKITLNGSYHRLEDRVDRFNCATNEETGLVEDVWTCLDGSSVALSRAPAILTRKRVYQDSVDVFGGFFTTDWAFLEDDLTLSIGSDVYYEEVKSKMRQADSSEDWAFSNRDGNFPDGATFLSAGAFAHGQYTVFRFADTWQLGINAGAKYAYAQTKANNEALGDVDSSFSGLVGTAGLVISDPTLMGIYFNWSQGFRAPNLQESVLVGNTGSQFTLANPELGPEKVSGFEGGLKINHEFGYARAAYFYNHIKDLIGREDALYEGQSEYDGLPVKRRINIGTAKYDGVEVSAGLRFVGFLLYGNGTWTRGKITGEDGEEKWGRRVPPIFYLLGLRYETKDEETYAEVVVRGDLEKRQLSDEDKSDLRVCEDRDTPGILRDPCNNVPYWTTVNLRMGHMIIPEVWADLAILNLADTRYRSLGSGYYAAGIGARLSLTARF